MLKSGGQFPPSRLLKNYMSETNNANISGKKEITLQEKIIGKLTGLRDNYSNDIPENIMDKYKGTKEWWTTVIPYLTMGIEVGIIQDPQLGEETLAFIKKYTSPEFHQQKIITPEDIKEANRIINLAIGSNQSTKMLKDK